MACRQRLTCHLLVNADDVNAVACCAAASDAAGEYTTAPTEHGGDIKRRRVDDSASEDVRIAVAEVPPGSDLLASGSPLLGDEDSDGDDEGNKARLYSMFN